MAAVFSPGTIHSDAYHLRMSKLSDLEKQSMPDKHEQFYKSSEFEDAAPTGLPSMAVKRSRFPNFSTFRTFECLYQRQLEFYEAKLCYLENQLYMLDKAEDSAMHGLQRKSVSFDKNIFMDCRCADFGPSDVSEALEPPENMLQFKFMDIRERLHAHVDSLSKKHREVTCWLREVRKFPRVLGHAHRQLFETAQEYYGLDNEALDHWRAMDEMAYTSIDPVELWIENIWFSVKPWVERIARCLPTRKNSPRHNGDQPYKDVMVNTFTILHKVLVVLSGLALILVPVSLLCLGGLSKALSLGVVVIFGVIFAVGITIIEDRISHVVVGIIAYLAVLSAFLANTT
ncbi:hypothetical protein F4678DRAFT_411750 [Xylaria arbuscula]|nr:hypothetical protein F4678DRAFT_411750 [Xylaria arbuscula]